MWGCSCDVCHGFCSGVDAAGTRAVQVHFLGGWVGVVWRVGGVGGSSFISINRNYRNITQSTISLEFLASLDQAVVAFLGKMSEVTAVLTFWAFLPVLFEPACPFAFSTYRPS